MRLPDRIHRLLLLACRGHDAQASCSDDDVSGRPRIYAPARVQNRLFASRFQGLLALAGAHGHTCDRSHIKVQAFQNPCSMPKVKARGADSTEQQRDVVTCLPPLRAPRRASLPLGHQSSKQGKAQACAAPCACSTAQRRTRPDETTTHLVRVQARPNSDVTTRTHHFAEYRDMRPRLAETIARRVVAVAVAVGLAGVAARAHGVALGRAL